MHRFNLTDIAASVLIAANLVVFLLLRLPGAEAALPWLQLSADPSVWLLRPWTLLTYAFTQLDYWHLTVNMLWLAFFGIVGQDGDSRRQWAVFVGLYLAGALAGGVGFCLFAALDGEAAWGFTLVGASSGVWAMGLFRLAQAIRRRSPRLYSLQTIFVFLLALFFVWRFVPSVSGTAMTLSVVAHCCGAATGLVCFAMTLRRRPPATPKVPDKRDTPKAAESQPASADPLTLVLAKARTSGYASLTPAERAALTRRRL